MYSAASRSLLVPLPRPHCVAREKTELRANVSFLNRRRRGAARLDCAATSNGAVISSSETDSARADVEAHRIFPSTSSYRAVEVLDGPAAFNVLVVPREVSLHPIALITRTLDAVVLIWIDDGVACRFQRLQRLVHLLTAESAR